MTNFSCQKTWSIDSLQSMSTRTAWVSTTGYYNMFKLPKLAGNWTPKRRTPLVFISQPGSAVLIVTSPGSAFTRRFPLCQLDRVREDHVNDGRHWRYLPHGIQIRWKFNFADRVIATITRHLCCCSMCITLQRRDSQEMNCNMYMISHRNLYTTSYRRCYDVEWDVVKWRREDVMNASYLTCNEPIKLKLTQGAFKEFHVFLRSAIPWFASVNG